MQRNGSTIHPLLRGLTSGIVAYTLVINALLSGIVGAEWVAKVAAGLVAEHCLTDAKAAGSNRAPAEHSDDSSHCVFCTAAAAPAVLPADLTAALIIRHRAAAPASMSDQGQPDAPGYPSKLPRGPPRLS